MEEYIYPSRYRIKDVDVQINVLHQHFPSLNIAEGVLESPLPEGAEGWFAIPRWQKVARSYPAAAEKVFQALADTRRFHNYCRSNGAPLVQADRRAAHMLDICGASKPDDVLVIPAQMGMRHRWNSKIGLLAIQPKHPNEFPLGPFEVGCILLSHPERLPELESGYHDTWRTLWIGCPGAMYHWEEEELDHVFPVFCNGNFLSLVESEDAFSPQVGIATGFLCRRT